MKSFDDVITVTNLWRHILFSVNVSLENQILSKFNCIEMLIRKMGWDWPLTMILAEHLQFPIDI